MIRLKLLLGVSAAMMLSACGLQGEPERPEPLWGEPPIDGPDDPRLKKPETEEEAPAVEDEEDVPDDELLGGLGG